MNQPRRPRKQYILMYSPWAVMSAMWLFAVLRFPLGFEQLAYLGAMFLGGALVIQAVLGWGLGWFSARLALALGGVGVLVTVDAWHVMYAAPDQPMFVWRAVTWVLLLVLISYGVRVYRQERQPHHLSSSW